MTGYYFTHMTLRLPPLLLPFCLSISSPLLRQVQQMRVPVVTRWGSWRIHQHKAFLRFWEDAKDVLAKVVLWRKTTHKIGGHFGGGVQSYFLFLRFLVVLNFLSFLLMAGFVIIPSIVFHSIANISSSIDLLPTIFSYLVYRMGSVTQVMVAAGGAAAGGYSALIFTGWDYGLQGERATTLKQKNLRYQLQVDLEEERINKMAASLTLTQTVGLYSLRTFLQLVVLAMIGGAFLGIAAATQFSQQQQGFVGLLLEYLPSIVITTSNFVVPMLCDKVALFEKYSPSTTIILALLRAVFLRLVSLGVLLYTLWNQITCNGDVSDRSTTDCATCSYNNLQYQCWETRVGQEMYKLTLFDFLITIAMLVFVEFPRRMVVDHCSCKLAQWVGRQEFLVPTNVLALVYGQTVVWTGALFCPLLPLINTVKFIIIFYCKKITLFQNCRPALRTFRSTSSSFFFFLVLLFGWGLSSVVLVYSVATIHPSYGCGPFRFSPTMWSVVPKSFHSLSNTTQEFLLYVGSQAFSIPLFISSCVFLCYVAALASVYGKTVALLKNQYKMVRDSLN
uniref:Transmembrane channel-like protein n=1 Tax=Astyanax mexicanus TaxID=7994 RepID=A0A8B9L1R2_ASTMX